MSSYSQVALKHCNDRVICSHMSTEYHSSGHRIIKDIKPHGDVTRVQWRYRDTWLPNKIVDVSWYRIEIGQAIECVLVFTIGKHPL